MVKKGSGGNKKTGRNKIKCTKYKSQKSREKNKIAKWNKIIKKLPEDNNMRKELERNIKKMELEMYR